MIKENTQQQVRDLGKESSSSVELAKVIDRVDHEDVQIGLVTLELNQPKILWQSQSKKMETNELAELMRERKRKNEPIFSSYFASNYWVVIEVKNQPKQEWLVKRYPKTYFKDNEKLYLRSLIGILVTILLGAIILVFSWYSYFNQIFEVFKVTIRQLVTHPENELHLEKNQLHTVEEFRYNYLELKEDLLKNRNELQSSEQRLMLLLDHLILGVVVIGNTGKIELFNPAARSLLEIDESALGSPYDAVIKSQILNNMIENVLITRESMGKEIELFVPDTKYLDINVIPYSRGGFPIDDSILVLVYDITAIKHLQMVRSDFVTNASHELRTPVTAIKGFAETLQMGAINDPIASEQFVEIIAKESNRLEKIIEDILELSKVEKEIGPKTARRFDIVSASREIIDLLMQRAKVKGIEVHLIAQGPIYYEADEHRYKQILTNLLDNAINYSGKETEVKVRIEELEDRIRISVADNGIGIPEQDQERIFERFYRVDRDRSRNSGGTGLGLSIVRNLVKVLNGTIEVRSRLGIGTTFTVTLPY